MQSVARITRVAPGLWSAVVPLGVWAGGNALADVRLGALVQQATALPDQPFALALELADGMVYGHALRVDIGLAVPPARITWTAQTGAWRLYGTPIAPIEARRLWWLAARLQGQARRGRPPGTGHRYRIGSRRDFLDWLRSYTTGVLTIGPNTTEADVLQYLQPNDPADPDRVLDERTFEKLRRDAGFESWDAVRCTLIDGESAHGPAH